jgi:fatty-acyl-CoA synthase
VHETNLFPRSLFDALLERSENAAFEHGARAVSRSELFGFIRQLAGAMQDVGLGPGSGVAIFTSVSPEAFAAHMAAHWLGCRVVGVRPGYAARQLAHVLGMGVDALLVDPGSLSPSLLEVAGTTRLLSLGPCPGALDLFAHGSAGPSAVPVVRSDAIAALYFTSGSTGQPKGCAMTYGALSEHWSWRPPDAWSPVACELAARFERYMLYGTFASLVVMEFLALCLLGGGTAVIPEPNASLLFPHAIERHRITGAIITVPRFNRMLDTLAAERIDVSGLRALMVSGSPISANRLIQAVERLGPIVYQGYGQTEAGSISMLTPDDMTRGPRSVFTSVGRPHPSVELSVRDEQNQPVPAGKSGEIYVRSPYQMAGYHRDADESRAVLQDGWLRTRDLGYVDETGLLHLVGRARDVVMVNAMVVYAGPIESALVAHPDVDQAYVTGAPDAQTGEAVHAFVVPAAGRAVDREALRSLVRRELGEDSVPKTITEIRTVPVAASGKPDKRALLDLHAHAEARP